METTLHRQLKQHYAGDSGTCEVLVGRYRIDVVQGDQLVEIQAASLSAIRDKIRALLNRHNVLVVKPLAARKKLIRLRKRGGPVVSARYSPRRESVYDLFLDLVHFVGVFPHPRLQLEVLLVELEEDRVPARRRRKDFTVSDRRLVRVVDTARLATAADLLRLIPPEVPPRFTTADLAAALDQPRWIAQKMAYCLRQTGGLAPVDKSGNAIVYERRAA